MQREQRHMSRYEKIKELWRGHRDEITVVLIGLYNEFVSIIHLGLFSAFSRNINKESDGLEVISESTKKYLNISLSVALLIQTKFTIFLIHGAFRKRIRHLRAWGIANCCLVFLYAGIITYECILSMSVERWFSAGLIFLYICAYSGSASVSMKTVSKIMMTWKSKENIPPYVHQNVVVFLVEIDTPLTPNTPSTMALPISQV